MTTTILSLQWLISLDKSSFWESASANRMLAKCSNDDHMDPLGGHQTIKGYRKPIECRQNDHWHLLNEIPHANGKPDKPIIETFFVYYNLRFSSKTSMNKTIKYHSIGSGFDRKIISFSRSESGSPSLLIITLDAHQSEWPFRQKVIPSPPFNKSKVYANMSIC